MISERLQQVIAHLGWNQSQLAEKIHSSKVQVSRWIRGKAVPTENSLRRICRATGCNLEWLLEGRGSMFEQGEMGSWVEELFDEKLSQPVPDIPKSYDNLENVSSEWVTDLVQGSMGHKQRISDLLTKAAVVLESNSFHRVALATSINAFYRAVELEVRQAELKQKDA